MTRRVRGGFACVVVALACTAVPAAAAPGLEVALAVDQPLVTVDLTGAAPPVLIGYEVRVANGGDAVVEDLVVELVSPPELRRAGDAGPLLVGDLAPGATWTGRFAASVSPDVTDAVDVAPSAVARAGDGTEVTSLPARTRVQVISAVTYERDPEPEVQGVAFVRPAPDPAPDPAPVLPATGRPLAPLVALAVACFAAGVVVLSRARAVCASRDGGPSGPAA